MPGTPILVVESDLALLARIEAILRRAGHDVAVATDGALAMNTALAAPPRLVVTATEMPLLDGFKLCQLLRTNPLTRELPFVFLTTKETTAAELGRCLRPGDEFLKKPLREEEFLARVDAALAHGQAAPATDADQQRLLGSLSEISLVDLLQVLRMNRRSGLLQLELDGRRGTLFLSEGEVVDAEVGRFRGEKAFCRTLAWQEGRFEFRPQPVGVPPLIRRPGENLVLEGLRQLDEVRRLRRILAPPGSRLELRRRFTGPPERLRPATHEVLRLLERFTALDDILDQSARLDYELCATLHALVERRIVAVAAAPAPEACPNAARPLLSLEDALKLGYELGVGREEGQRSWSGKVLLVSESGRLLRRFLERLASLKEFRIGDAAEAGQQEGRSFGPVGMIEVLEGTELVLYALPGTTQYRPLWESLASGAIGGIALAESFPPLPPFARTSDAVLQLPFVIAGPGLQPPDAGVSPAEDAPKVRWSVVGYEEGSAEGHRAVFRALFSLVLRP
jgi:CheY-like chemotaxis protein